MSDEFLKGLQGRPHSGDDFSSWNAGKIFAESLRSPNQTPESPSVTQAKNVQPCRIQSREEQVEEMKKNIRPALKAMLIFGLLFGTPVVLFTGYSIAREISDRIKAHNNGVEYKSDQPTQFNPPPKPNLPKP